MIENGMGNLLKADAEALVNTVNLVGYMGKGIALQFKQAFPENFLAYQKAIRRGEIGPRRVFTFATDRLTNPKYIINFPTKRHWRGKARIEDIVGGLESLVAEVIRLGIHSIAVPPLGCGNGGLNWREVEPLIRTAFAQVPEVRAIVFPPVGAPLADSMPVATTRPKMTVARALLIKLMEQYGELQYRLTLLEIQKLAYLLQEAGEPLRLNYEAALYGPYAHNLNKVLERIEGHFIRGYGDSQKPDTEITLLQEAVLEADSYLTGRDTSTARLRKVGKLIEGFETPYGMELLASVHWVSQRAESPASSPDQAFERIHGWNDRKRQMVRENHVRVAWNQLKAEGWI